MEVMDNLFKNPLFIAVIASIIGAIIGACAMIFVGMRQNLLNLVSQELQDYITINKIEQKILDCKIEKESNKGENSDIYNKKIELLETAYRDIFENLCSRYLRNKIDKKNFEEMYKGWLISLVENSSYKEFYSESPYKKTLEVYKKFKNKI